MESMLFTKRQSLEEESLHYLLLNYIEANSTSSLSNNLNESDFCCQAMDNYQGDLTDIFRSNVTSESPAIGCNSDEQPPSNCWQLPSYPMQLPKYSFGYPFSTTGDPLLGELGMAGSSFFNGPNSMEMMTSNSGGFGDGGTTVVDNQMKMLPQDILQISSSMAASPELISNSAMDSSKGYSLDSSPVPISRNPPGIKRRKGHERKVMCVVAPTAANSRPSSGEVVPSDMWAWRKYGQKPIKGSPFPRGYYRCSTSKDCLARKQVERSRTDPNMLVITYCSEHNHPWPTQRNALAGSTRSSSKNPPTTKEEESNITDENSNNLSPLVTVKEEIEQDNQMEMDQENQSDDFYGDLGEIEVDPLSLLQKERKVMNPFSLYDWSEETIY